MPLPAICKRAEATTKRGTTLRYAGMLQIDDFTEPGSAKRLDRVALTSNDGQVHYDEGKLQSLLAIHPQALPICDIEPFLADAVPVCTELGTFAGPVDLVLVTPHGDIVLVECKLWRNPQARREVVGQIIDYAKELPRHSFEAFDTAVRKASPAGQAAKTDSLYQRSGAQAAGIDEASFVDAVTRNLQRGRFLLLIVGDGIREGVQTIVEFLQQHAGMHFTLALVEIAIFKLNPSGYLVQPRVLARTEMVPRGVVAIEDGRTVVRPAESMERRAAAASRPRGPLEAVPATISEAKLYEMLDARLPGGASRLQELLAALEERGASPRLTATLIVLQGVVGDELVELGRIDPATATVWFEQVVAQATARGRRDGALGYYQSLANLVRDPQLREAKLRPKSKTGTATLPLDDLLSAQASWLTAAETYLGALGR